MSKPIRYFHELCHYYMPDWTDRECSELMLAMPPLASPHELAEEVHRYMRDVMGVNKMRPDIAT
jgi:hypothetical protein